MKATKKIVGATAALVAAIALSAGSTFAWFATNSTVTVTGMQVGVAASSDFLVVASSEEELKSSTKAEISFTDSNPENGLKPCTHGEQSDGSQSNNWTGLKYASDPSEISNETGLASDNQITYSDVTPAVGDDYFIDYKLYVAGLDVIENQNLTVKFDSTSASTDTLKALSIDFYMSDSDTTVVSEANYSGTLNIAGHESGNVSSKKVELTLDTAVTIPNRTEGYFVIVMRVYFDGELKKDANNAYIHSSEVDFTKIDFNVIISCTPNT